MNLGNNFVLLETHRKDKDNKQNILFTDPVDIIIAYQKDDLSKSFKIIDKYTRRGFYVAGYISYEAGYFFENVLRPYLSLTGEPLLWFGAYKNPRISATPFITESYDDFYSTSPEASISYNDYKNKIRTIKNLISIGQVYQINYTFKNYFTLYGDVVSFYKTLKDNQQVSYSALIGCRDKYIVSLSPELFFRISNNKIKVKPMKGTAPIIYPSRRLLHDGKDLSENVMIVDLLRNDLGRICAPVTVKVDKLYNVERYDTLSQMTSTISGELRPELNTFDIIRNIFPSGSVTGAPKVQSMKIISAMEKIPRGVYTGAIGYFAPKEKSVFNVAIRTIELRPAGEGKYQGQMGVGGGIVHESRASKEYDECRLKAEFLKRSIPDLALIETMLCENGKIRYLRMHLQRLRKSAKYFLVPCDISRIKNALIKYANTLSGKVRVRLTLKACGRFKIANKVLPAASGGTRYLAISKYKTKSDNPFLYHKTTFRSLYDREHARYAARGYDDVIFCNENNQITEGAISNIFVQVKNRYYTPPVSCGLLNGIYRQIFMKKVRAKEKIIYCDDLKKADKIILTNSIRGAREAFLR
ncbi:MAG TPA: chorismate-binding protein [Smithellaceae bacterium]|nr:chorismate-binding protein [Smithellaceae bacterium]HRS90297.1 chorismate-binding protein [Smithellaceae bacterium]HRV26147.1 chorismate-binding protein [Smithellaceae bacterium]